MPAADTTWTPPRPLAAGALLWFELLALAVGAAHLAVDTGDVTHPALLGFALGLLAAAAAVAHLVPILRKRHWWRCAVETSALLIYATALCFATGGTHSPLLALFLLPLTAAAIALGRAAYGVTALLVALAGALLGAVTPAVDIASPAFVVLLISTLAPAVVATAAIAVLMENMQDAEQQIRDLASTDTLTGLLNLRTFDQTLATEHRKAERVGRPYSLVVVDIDNIRQINETLGHDAGSQMIVAVSAALLRSIRTSDVAARLGGDELVVLLLDADPTTAATIAQRIRNNVYAGTISVGNRLLRANVCLGVASFPKDHLSTRELMILADQRMQQDRSLRQTATT